MAEAKPTQKLSVAIAPPPLMAAQSQRKGVSYCTGDRSVISSILQQINEIWNLPPTSGSLQSSSTTPLSNSTITPPHKQTRHEDTPAANRTRSNPRVRTPFEQELDIRIAEFFYTCGIPFDVVTSDSFMEMIFALADGRETFTLPTIQDLRTTLLDQTVARINAYIETNVLKKIPILGCSISLEAWKDSRDRPLMNVIINSSSRSVFVDTVECFDLEYRDDDHIVNEVKSIITSSNFSLKDVIQITTDNTPLFADVGMKIATEFNLLYTTCASQVVDLMIQDCASLPIINDVVTRARNLAVYFRYQDSLLQLLESAQPLGPLRLLKHASTRFASNITMMERLIAIRKPLERVTSSDEWDDYHGSLPLHRQQLIASELVMTADEVVRTVADSLFWQQLDDIVSLFKPMTDVLKVIDTDTGHCSKVFSLVERVKSSVNAYNSEWLNQVKNLICLKVEHHTSFLVNDIILAAHALDPENLSTYCRTAVTDSETIESNRYIMEAVKRMADRILEPQERSLLDSQFLNFLSREDGFETCSDFGDDLTSVQWWRLNGASSPVVKKLAVKLISQVTSVGTSQRVWSSNTFIHTHSRNRLDREKSKKVVYIHMNYKLRQQSGLSKQRWSEDRFHSDTDYDSS
ncbi:hypothetical protein GEMRC1_000473 [Eukaryota sp. GEM-RC1]